MAQTINKSNKSSPGDILKQALSYQNSGDLVSAENLYRKLLYLTDNADAANLLGCLLMGREEFQEAETLIKKAIKLKPSIYFFHYHLGLLYCKQYLWNKAIEAFEMALSLNPDHLESMNNLGVAFTKIGNIESAIKILKKALVINPNHGESCNNIATSYMMIGDIDNAHHYYTQAIKNVPKKPEFHKNIAAVYRKRNQLDQAELHLSLALKYAPGYIQALNDYGVILKDQGKNNQAYKIFCKLIDLDRKFLEAQSNRLFLLHYLPEKTPEFIFQEHFRWGKNVTNDRLCPKRIHNPQKKRIHVGYISPDFRDHSVSHFMKPILQNHHSDEFKIFCYANVFKPDQVTVGLKSFKNIYWRDIFGIPDEYVNTEIENDGIDILVDLAGHSANNRLMVFVHKPAPIQVTYLGYPNTTGLSTIDYRITDSISDPEGQNHLYTETLIYLEPCFLCYSPPENVDITNDSVSDTKIIFGSFNIIGKLNNDVIKVWSTILKKVPDSQILLKSAGFTCKDTQSFWREKFLKYGIKDHQLQFLGYITEAKKHLITYQSIDIALDTFPYNGTTTTFEALWMGTPVVTLAGNSHVSRVGHTILTTLGLKDFIARTEREYVDKVIQLASNRSLLKNLKKQLRHLLINSVLTDGKKFTRQLEQNYKTMMRDI